LGELQKRPDEGWAEDPAQCKGVYFTLNPFSPVSLSGQSATDADILRRRWLFIDADPDRPGKGSATDAEKAKAWALVERVRAGLSKLGWPEPIVCDSGNGYHLLYRIDLPADDAATDLIQRVLHGIARAAQADGVHIDTKVFNASRICKLPFTMACKGESTPERPHRMATVLHMPAELHVVPRDLLERVAVKTVPAASSAARKATARKAKAADLPEQRPVVLPEDIQAVLRSARGYLRTVPNAVSGKGGDLQTFKVACYLARGFALPFEAGFPLFEEYNARLKEKWEAWELKHKWYMAEQRGTDEWGGLLRVRTSMYRRITRGPWFPKPTKPAGSDASEIDWGSLRLNPPLPPVTL
jgi:hypothetical protein